MSDTALKNIIQNLQSEIVKLARFYDYEAYKFWNYLDFHRQEPSDGESCAGVLTCDGQMLSDLTYHGHTGFPAEFERLVEKAGFTYEFQNDYVIHFYSMDDQQSEAYRELLEWQWITFLIQPEYTFLYNELFDFFHKNPNKFYSLSPRQLELYVGEVFRNQGYDIEMGPGTKDGGIDLRLYQRQDIDQITTLVQVKRYKESIPIRLDAVAALYGHMEANGAQEGVFVTTSRYLPGVKHFADRIPKKITLLDSHELAAWSNKVKTTILQDKSQLISNNQLMQLVDDVNAGKKKNFILIHHHFSRVIYCEFALLLKETKFAALIIMLPKRIHSLADDPPHRRGNEVPVLDYSVLENKTNEHLFRVIVTIEDDGSKTYKGRDKFFSVWDGMPGYFDWND